MTRKRIKKSHVKTSQPALQQQANQISPSSQAVIDRVTAGGKAYLMENIIRIMTDSTKLAEEPEFSDLTMSVEKAAETSLRWMEKYGDPLDEAKSKSPDEYEEAIDNMSIEMISELATPAFRKDVKNRLQAMLDRLMAGKDLEKLELALLVKRALVIKDIPWSLCGLVMSIFDRTMEKMVEAHNAEMEVFDEMVGALKESGIDEIELEKLIESPEEFEPIGEKIFEARPDLRERAEKQISDMLDDFEANLLEGKIELDLFTEAEILLPFQQVAAEIEDLNTEVEPSEEMEQRVIKAVVQSISQLMTPERYQRLVKYVQTTANTWMRERKKWAAALHAELSWLDEKQYEETSFVMSAFMGQFRRLAQEKKPATKKKERARS